MLLYCCLTPPLSPMYAPVQTECGVSPYPPKKKDVSGDFGLKGYKPHGKLMDVQLYLGTSGVYLATLG